MCLIKGVTEDKIYINNYSLYFNMPTHGTPHSLHAYDMYQTLLERLVMRQCG